jgi:hypothetical protein
MAFKRDRTRKTLMWLDFYGICREGGMSPFATQQFMDEGSDVVGGSMAEMEMHAGASAEKSKAAAETAGSAVAAVGGVIFAATSGTGVGAIVGIVVAAIGAIISLFARLFTVECDKYHCQGYDRDTRTERRIYSEHRQALVGANITVSKSRADADRTCRCKLRGHRCSFIRFMHDGLMSEGLDLDRTDAEPTTAGRLRGVNGYGLGRNAGCERYWMTHPKYKPLTANKKDIPVGQKKDPWEGDANSYYARSWKVHSILSWMQGDHILCRTMECMEEVLIGTPGVGRDTADDQKRRRGSRWYSSIVWMMRDVWETGQKLGWDKFEELSRNARASDAALKELRRAKAGHEYDEKEVPFEWWPFLKHFTIWQLRQMLIEMKPLFPYMPVAGMSQPEGQERRVRAKALRPMLLPIKQPIMFGRNMRPIPAKIGRRGPGWGTILIGLGASAFGAYAIYKLVSTRGEE